MNLGNDKWEIVVVGAGAAGLAAAICAAEAGAGRRLLIIEGAKKPGAKILVSGGGRCNVTNEQVTPEDYWGGSRAIVRNVLAQFDDQRTRRWFASLGVELKREPQGKYFPVSDRAQTVLDALLRRVGQLGITLWTGTRVREIVPEDGRLALGLSDGQRIAAQRVVVACGGLALPKSGSDGAGLEMMRALGHTIVPTTPALTPLVLRRGPALGGRFAEFSGIAIDATLRLCRRGHAKPLSVQSGALLFTHFGLSGPAAMNMSRHWLRERLEHPQVALDAFIGSSQFDSTEQADAWLLEQSHLFPTRHLASALTAVYTERLAAAIAGDANPPLSQLAARDRRKTAHLLTALPVEIAGARDYSHAEATAGGVALNEIDYRTMQSRKVPGLFLCGEILDVDGRIGGFNFQWAWSSGYVAGRGAARA